MMGFLAMAVVLIAGLASYAVAQSSGGAQTPAVQAVQNGDASRHVDYDVTLQVNGDLTAVDPKLQGILPLNLSAKGGADIAKSGDSPAAQGNLQLSGVDAVIQKLAAENGGVSSQAALGAGLISGFLSDIQFVAVDKVIYVNLGGTWYDTGDMSRHGDAKPDDENGDKDKARACAKDAFPGGPKALLKDVKTVGQEDIDGAATTHTTATVDLDKALTEAATAARNCGKTDEAGKLETAKSQILGAVKQLNLDWWTDTDGQLRQAKAAIELNPASLAPLAAGMAANKPGDKPDGKAKINAEAVLKGITSVKLDATVRFSRFGEDFQIAKPDGDIKPLKDLLGFAGGHKRTPHSL